ncbi:hypothetical protein UFOVP836_48 [uncultured Caudovirales phage]|uniref:Uncharacterized protein n=1 Tax=uncultured Caudovirales phage TaxID=2100421 RepID=A0A6J5PB58_9CAUD|nr:hypothetical protein UFOVP836_48 [uncultured Caudovirales phage]
MAKPRNVITRRGRWGAEVKGLVAVQQSFGELSAILIADGRVDKYRRGLDIVKQGFASAAIKMQMAVRSSLGGRSNRLTTATFAFYDLDAGRTKAQKRSSLVGVKTGAPPRKNPKLYVEWGDNAKGHATYRSHLIKRNGGFRIGALGMSLARIMESGTRYQRGTKFFSSAIRETKSAAIQILVTAYKDAIRLFNG